MKMIHVPRPPKSSMNADRRASSLLLMQVEQMHTAEKRLPRNYRTDIYVNAIRTEREAANYIREVTEAIHRAHADSGRRRVQAKPKRSRTLQIAAAADESAVPPQTARAPRKKQLAKRKQKNR